MSRVEMVKFVLVATGVLLWLSYCLRCCCVCLYQLCRLKWTRESYRWTFLERCHCLLVGVPLYRCEGWRSGLFGRSIGVWCLITVKGGAADPSNTNPVITAFNWFDDQFTYGTAHLYVSILLTWVIRKPSRYNVADARCFGMKQCCRAGPRGGALHQIRGKIDYVVRNGGIYAWFFVRNTPMALFYPSKCPLRWTVCTKNIKISQYLNNS